MKIQKYIDQKKEIYDLLFEIFESEYEYDENFQNFDNISKKFNQQEKKEESREFLYLLLKIANNYHRSSDFLNKIYHIFTILKDEIKQTFSNFEIFNLFKNNRQILLFLFKEGFITPDESIIQYILKRKDANNIKYCHFFYPEIKFSIDEIKRKEIEDELLKIKPDIFLNFDEKRKKGENDSHICEMIRNDSVKEFISYFNRTNQSLSSEILPSLFETNRFLIKNKTSLIEYAAFFGSIQIFQYLRLSNVELKPSLWLYVIHSKNPELIHILEENHVNPPNNSYEKCLEESIKCHHNDIANYILNNLIEEKDESIEKRFNQNYISYCFHYYNFYFNIDYSESKINQKLIFFYACQFNYINLVNLFLRTEKLDLNAQIV